MGLSDDLERLFGERDPYAVLEVSKDASSSRIKQAYFRLAKLWHPDKVTDGVDSAVHTEKFQALSKLYSIFSDGEKRKLFDETKSFQDDELSHENWTEYGVRVTKQDIEEFMKVYKGSPDEEEDLKKYFIRFEGNLDHVYECVIGSNPEVDDERFRLLIDRWIAEKEVEPFPRYVKEKETSKRKRIEKAKRERKEFDDESSKASEADLRSIILAKSQSRGGFLDSLEAKYSKPAPAARSSKRRGK